MNFFFCPHDDKQRKFIVDKLLTEQQNKIYSSLADDMTIYIMKNVCLSEWWKRNFSHHRPNISIELGCVRVCVCLMGNDFVKKRFCFWARDILSTFNVILTTFFSSLFLRRRDYFWNLAEKRKRSWCKGFYFLLGFCLNIMLGPLRCHQRSVQKIIVKW